MEHAELCAALAEALTRCRARYEAAREDAHLSHVYAAEIETLEALAGRAANGVSAAELAAQAHKKLPELEQAMHEEYEHPTFDWYNEHYHYLRLEGQRDAWLTVQTLLKPGP